MWLCLNNSFLSIVSKDCGPHELLVRARRKGDIERVFPNATVTVLTVTDYRFRAVVKRWAVIRALARSVRSIDYPNFKDSVKDDSLHNAYLKVWQAMADLQPTKPYFGHRYEKQQEATDDQDLFDRRDQPHQKRGVRRRAKRR